MTIQVSSEDFGNGWKDVEIKEFRGGELNVKLPADIAEAGPYFIDIRCHATKATSLMELVLVSDALERAGHCIGDLYLPYLPYARQDRVCNPGEALSCKVAADLINSVEAGKVITVDPHSDVMPALIKNLQVVPLDMILNLIDLSQYDMVVAPDAGASKKVFGIAQKFGKSFGQGMKHRDLASGELSGFSFNGDCKGKKVLIIDDICEGGGTFTGLAKILEDQGAETVDLYVTHGIFSRGVPIDGINKVYTTNSLDQAITDTDKFTVFNLF